MGGFLAPASGYIYTSTDSGATWTEQTDAGSHQWGGVASSAFGGKLVAGVFGGFIILGVSGQEPSEVAPPSLNQEPEGESTPPQGADTIPDAPRTGYALAPSGVPLAVFGITLMLLAAGTIALQIRKNQQ